jgi:prepilin-type N-terminal cleavage/methylation domain-containing protein/prepilin-type processing-associated H-X9-DG protein
MRLSGQSIRRIPLRQQQGFTLLELAAVVFIITILVSLLCAALNHTKTKTLRLSCLENMRQLQFAWQLYTLDYDDRLPLNQEEQMPKRIPYVNSSSNSWVTGNPMVDRTTANIRRGKLFPYVKSTAIYRCPLDSAKVWGHDDSLRTRSYAMNAYLGGREILGISPRMWGHELVSPPPQHTFVFIEEHENSLWNAGFFVSPRSKLAAASLSWLSTPSDRHEQGCNITFADGHIEYWKWASPKTDIIAQQLTSNGRELRDIRRLQSAIPVP